MKNNDEMMYVDNWILTNELPRMELEEITWRLLLHMYKIVDLTTGLVSVCYRSCKYVVECEEEDYVDTLDWFEQVGLIRRDSNLESASFALLTAKLVCKSCFYQF